jgi:signal transduction histidine kinase
LQQSAEQLVAGTDITLEFATTGERRPLPEVVEENVLRIGQEAFTNIAKHARAKRVATTLEFAPNTLRLRVEDDGIGFDPPTAPSASENHFGLLGMTERAKRLGGQLILDSTPGRGTSVTVEIPLEPLDELR